MINKLTILISSTLAAAGMAFAGGGAYGGGYASGGAAGAAGGGIGLPSTSLGSSAPISLADGWQPMLKKGNRELSVAGRLHFDGLDDIEYNLDLSYGWFIADAWEVGFTANLVDADESRRLSGGLFTEYNFNHTGRWVPYIGASANLASADLSGGIGFEAVEKDAFLVDVELGVKYFIRPHMALAASINFEWSPDDIFGAADDVQDAASNILIGMRFYF